VVSWTKQRAALKIPFVFTVDFEFGFSLSLLSIRFFLISMPEKVSQTQASDKRQARVEQAGGGGIISSRSIRSEEHHHPSLKPTSTLYFYCCTTVPVLTEIVSISIPSSIIQSKK
jgi:hypothetical protein